jgi:hypothetical protein
MNDLPVHLLLFAFVGLVISALNAVFADADDAAAARSLPRRSLWFFGGCGILAALILLAERFLARTW